MISQTAIFSISLLTDTENYQQVLHETHYDVTNKNDNVSFEVLEFDNCCYATYSISCCVILTDIIADIWSHTFLFCLQSWYSDFFFYISVY